MSCSAFTSWEIQDNLKLRSVVSEKIVSNASEQSTNEDEGKDVKLSDIGIPEHSVTLRPFLHPELTDASRDACELRLHCEPRHNLSVRSVTVVATARNTELYDRKGEYLQTVRGLNIPGSSWYRFLYSTAEPCYEIKLKFLSLMQPGKLMLGNVEVQLDSHSWPAQYADPTAQSVPSLLERLSEVELSPHARSVLNLLCTANQQQQHQQQQQQQHHLNSSAGSRSGMSGSGASGGSQQQQQQVAATTAAVAGLRTWLEARLEAIERRLDDRLARIEARMEAVAAAAAAPASGGDNGGGGGGGGACDG